MRLKNQKRRLMFFTVFIISLSICITVTTLYVINKSRMEYAQMQQIVLLNANKVNNVITKLLYKTQVLSALVVQNDGNITDFARVAATIVDDPAVKNVLIAPDGIVTHVYPSENNEQAVGLNFFKQGDGNQEAIQAKETGALVLGGPFDLVQGGQALVGRLPVYIKNEDNVEQFWGLVSVTLHYPQALEGAGLDQLQNQGFAYEIWRTSPDTGRRQLISGSPYEYNNSARYVEQSISILNADWEFRISPIKNWYQYPESWIFGISSLIISLLIAFFLLNNQDLRHMKDELEALTYIDPLTDILNRRGLLVLLDQLVANVNCKLSLFYIDLNNFKSINDTHGHSTGDKVLHQFASTIKRLIDDKILFARVGGDEFILVFEGNLDEQKREQFFDRVRAELTLFSKDEYLKDISLNFSVGAALYPSPCRNIDELFSAADNDMYRHKSSRKKEDSQQLVP